MGLLISGDVTQLCRSPDRAEEDPYSIVKENVTESRHNAVAVPELCPTSGHELQQLPAASRGCLTIEEGR